MDDGRVAVDDLFGDTGMLEDTVGLNLPLRSVPVEGLALHLDEVHRASTKQ